MSEDEEIRTELAAMQAVADALTPLETLPDNGSVDRILRWACSRWGVLSL